MIDFLNSPRFLQRLQRRARQATLLAVLIACGITTAYHAARSVAYGLPQEEAMKALTLNAAEILGVSDRGSRWQLRQHELIPR